MTATKLKVRIYGDPALRKKSSIVKGVGSSERMLIQSMLATMYDHKGIGLAAPQVGINTRIFVADAGNGPTIFVNPKIIKKSGSDVLEEGCLSIPGVTVMIKRPTKILIKYMDENNKKIEAAYDELMARVIQHETDHLDGKLIIDYTSSSDKKKLKPQLDELEQYFKES